MWSAVSTLIVGAVGAFISWQQWRIAEIRLRNDTYERKFRVYEAAKTLLVVFQRAGKFSEEDYVAYLQGTMDAEFIFDDPEVMQYLQLLRGQVGELMRLKAQKSADEYARVSLWFTKQFDVLRSTFHPSMRLNPPPMQEQVVQWAAGLLTNLRLGGSKTLRYP